VIEAERLRAAFPHVVGTTEQAVAAASRQIPFVCTVSHIIVYDDFESWFDQVQQMTPLPVVPDSRWYDAFLDALDPQEAVHSIEPMISNSVRHSFKIVPETLLRTVISWAWPPRSEPARA
jgi:hypothetical protein